MKRLALLLAVAAALLAPAAASAHPLGNFTINRFSRVEVSGHRLYVLYVLDLAEIPTFQAGHIDARAYARKVAAAQSRDRDHDGWGPRHDERDAAYRLYEVQNGNHIETYQDSFPQLALIHTGRHSVGAEPYAQLARNRHNALRGRGQRIDDAAQLLTFATRAAIKRPNDKERAQLSALLEVLRSG